jgi:hypothetical protein
MDMLIKYIEDLIKECNDLITSLKGKPKTNQAPKSSKPKNNGFMTVTNVLDSMIGNFKLTDIDDSSIVNIQAGRKASIRGNVKNQTLNVSGNNINIVNGKVYVDGKLINGDDIKQGDTVDLTVVVGVESAIHSLSIEGNATINNDGYIDRIETKGNQSIVSGNAVSYGTIKAGGNMKITGDISVMSVTAGGNVTSSGKINWV